MRFHIGLIVACCIGIGYTADHGIFKDCGRVDYCKDLRNTAPTNRYTLNITSFYNIPEVSPILKFVVHDTEGKSDLAVTIYGLEDNNFRMKITETDSVRYELQDVLDDEPILHLEFEKEASLSSASLKLGTEFDPIHSEARITYSPFKIEFSRYMDALVVFNGDRLTMARNEVNAPFSFGVTFPQAVQLYGLHEHADSLALKTTGPGGIDPYRLKNSDVANYELNSPMALYGAIPVLYGHGQKTAGVFLHNAAEQWIDIKNSASRNSQAFWMTETGTLDLFVLLGSNPRDVIRQYTNLTGTAHMPQLWTLGYHQSRYSYDTQDDVKNVIANFNKNKFPLDAIWLDIDYTDGFKYFTWNPSTFSDPIELQKSIEAVNKKLVTIIDPHIKAEKGYSVYDGGIENDLFVKNADGSVFAGPCWPGTSSYMDFLNPAAREFYSLMYSYENFPNTTSTLAGIWNDMNEPSVFDGGLEMTLPADSLHHGNVTHREIHNIYGYLHTMSTHTGLMLRDNNKLRPFVLTRSHFAGSQRYAAIWTGDNTADWGYLAISYTECLNANILGIVFCGADVGGFFQNPDDELFQRWYQAGAWLPFFRAHSEKTTARREPYLLPEDAQVNIRNAIEQRYSHLPVWYTLFYEHTRNGDPLIRPLFYHYPEDQKVNTIDDQLLVGSDILVCPVTKPGVKYISVYFPGGSKELWVAADGSEARRGGPNDVPVDLKKIPVFYRKGSVIVRKDTVRMNTADMVDDAYTLYVILDENREAHGKVYLDDNESFHYQNGDFNYISIDFKEREMTTSNIEGIGKFNFKVAAVKFYDVDGLNENSNLEIVSTKQFNIDVNGRVLKDITINAEEVTILKL